MNKSITLMMIIAGAISWSSVAEGVTVVNKSSYNLMIEATTGVYKLRAKASFDLDLAGPYVIYSFPANGKIELKRVEGKIDYESISYGKVDSSGNMKTPKTLRMKNALRPSQLGIAIDVGVVTGFKVGYFETTNPSNIMY